MRLLVVLLLAAVACSRGVSDESLQDGSFRARVEDGASCGELFAIRNSRDPNDPAIHWMNQELRRVGCYSDTSERSDQPGAYAGESAVEPSVKCVALMRQAAAAPIEDDEVEELVDSLTVCRSAEMWLEAVRREPGAMGLKSGADVGDLDLQVACHGHEETLVCRDAADQGRL